MAMTPSQLSIIVSSKGVADATVELDKLAKAAASVDAETKSFVIAQSKLAESNKKVSQSSEATARGVTTQELAMIKLHEAANRMNAAYIKQEEAQKKLINGSIEKALKEQADAAAKVAKAQEKLEKSELAAKLREQTKEAAAAKKEMEALAREADRLAKAQDKITKSTLNAEMRAQEKAMKATARAAAELEKAHGDALEMNKKITAQRVAASAKESSANQLNARGITDYQLSIVKAHEAANKMNEVIDKKNKRLKEQADNLKNASHHGNIFNNTLRSMATAALAYMGVNFFTGIVKDADAWAMMQAKLNLAVGGMQMAKIAQKDLYEMSQRVRVPLEDSAKLFTRMSVPLQRMGQSVGEVQKVVESFSMALKLGGATGQEASSAMLQLSQSFNAGRLNGGEFNSVAEAAPSVLRAVEVELIRVGKGADLAKYGLKELAARGVLSTEIMAEALKRAAPKWKEEFEKLPLTVDGAITRIKNAWLKAIGEMGQDTKFNEELAKTLSKLEAELPRIANAIGKAMLFVVNNGEALLKTLGAIVALFAASKIIEAGYTFAKLAESIGLVTAAGNLLGLTPIGRVILGISAVVGAGAWIWKNYADKQREAEEASKKHASTIPEIIASLEAETEALKKQNKERMIAKGLMEPDKPTVKVELKDLNEVQRAIIDMNNMETNLAVAKKKFKERVDNTNAAAMQQAVTEAEAQVRFATINLSKVTALYREITPAREAEKQVQLEQTRKKASDLLVAEYEEPNKKAKKLMEEKLATLKTQYNEEAVLKDANLKNTQKISEEAYKIAKAGIKREYEASLEKGNKQRDVASELTNLDKVNKLLAEQNTLNKEWNDSQRTRLTSGQRFIEDVEVQNKALEKTLKKGEFNNKLLTDAEKIQIRKTLETNKEAIAVGKIVSARQKYRELEQDEVSKFERTAKAYETEVERLDILERELYLEEESKIAKQQQSVIEAEITLEKARQNIATNQELVDAMKTLKVRQDTLKVMQQQEIKDKSGAEAKKYEDSFQAANKKISDGLYNAIGKGSDSAIKKLTQDLKSWAARLVLSPIIEPISKFGAGIMNPNAASAQGSAGNIMELGSTLYKSITTGFEAASTAAGSAFTSFATSAFGEAIGLSSSAAAMSAEVAALTGSTIGAGTTAGLTTAGSLGASAASMMPYVAAAVAAFQGVKAINGEYRLGGLSADMGALLGVMPRLFGMAEKKFADQTVTGNLGTNNLSRNQAWTQSGGLFRSDRADTWKYMLSNSTATTSDGKSYQDTANVESDKALLNQLTSMYSAVKVASAEYAKTLGLNAESIKTRTDAINFTFGKTAEETSANISKAFEAITNSIAKDLLGNLSELALQNETSAQTMGRLATNISATNAMFKALGYSVFELNAVGIKAADSIVTLFGGLDKFQTIASSYYDNFYDEQEKTKVKTDAVTKALKDLGKEMPSSREAFRIMVEQAKAAGNNELFVGLMKVSSAFAEVVQWTEKAAEAVEKMDYTNTDPMFPDMSTLLANSKEVFNELSQTAQKWLSVSKQTSDLRASINNLLWGNVATQEAAVKKSEKLWKMMATDITVEQKLSLAGELKDSIISKYQLERDSITKLIDFSKQLRTYVDGLKLGSLSPLTMTQKLAEARRQYEATLAKAQAGDTTAQGALTGSASAYLELAKTAYASSDAYQSIFMNITSTLESMTLDTKTADEKLLEVNQRQEAELIKLIYALDTIESVADSYYKTSLQGMSAQLKALQDLYTRMGVFDGVATELNALPAEIAAALSGTFGRTSGKDYVEALYSKFAGKTGNQIDKEGMDYWSREFELYGREYVTKAFQDSVAKTTKGIDVPKSPFAPAPQASVEALTASNIAMKEELVKLREDAQMQTIALMETLTLTSKQNADRIVEGTTEGMDKNNPNWNKATLT